MKGKNAWLDHVKKVKSMKSNKGKTLADVLKEAKKTYKPKQSK